MEIQFEMAGVLSKNWSSARVSTALKQLSEEIKCDFIALGLVDAGSRKLHWPFIIGRLSDRTLLVEQKTDIGLSGTALRSGRMAVMNTYLTDKERFNLKEPLLLTEGLHIAASFPLSGEPAIVRNKHVKGVLLIGRRNTSSFTLEELELASRMTEQITDLLMVYHEVENDDIMGETIVEASCTALKGVRYD